MIAQLSAATGVPPQALLDAPSEIVVEMAHIVKGWGEKR